VLGVLGVWVGAVLLLTLLYTVVPPVSTLMLGRWLTLRGVERTAVSLDEISPHLTRAVISSEDGRFCQHGGVDWDALRQVIEEADDDGPSRGASTIPMQVAKNLFLWPSRSYLRKGMEIPLALVIDLAWSKRRLLENYLNIVELGDGVFGAEAAARRYFGKRARDLSASEAALLAAALPNPLARNPGRPSARHRALARRLVTRMDVAAAATGCLR
jgi:monofunctional biosynthetic peptidoglycan transglycosylase